ncbi:MAG TPA: tetratricopeptide repeat protein [Xanthobacteraceae bacterium]|nr:tetratricopeptide repeat protein [Xanthobacteraceae bacterium]
MNQADPALAQHLYAQGLALQQRGQLAEAISAWKSAVARDSHHADARYNLAVALGASGNAAGAESSYLELLSQHPDHVQALYNFANLKMRQGEVATAEPLYRRLLALAPGFTNGWVNLAMARSASGDLPEAESCLRRALELEPSNVGAHWNLANLLLASWRWSEAWAEYEWRLRRPQCPPPPTSAPDWMPDDTQARRILLWNDQGMGDALQFARYARFVSACGHEVWLFAQDALRTLLRSVPGVSGVVGPSDPTPQVDAQAPLLSMPYRLQLSDPGASWAGAYVTPQREMALPRRPGHLAVGLVWASNPAHPNRVLRDVPLKQLQPLLDIPDIDWFALQVGSAAGDVAAHGFSSCIHDLSPQIHNFGDTAAAVEALDLVITVDTSVPHLVGAMGKPCWAMISTAREWRWSGREAMSIWYPSMRLFRQSSAGDWGGVLAKIEAELRAGNLMPTR